MGMFEMPKNINQERPGKALPEGQMWEPWVDVKTGEQVGAKGTEGKFYRFDDGESLVLVREGSGGRKPFIRLRTGEEVGLYDWQAEKTKNNTEAFRTADPDYAQLYTQVIDEYPEMSQIEVVSSDKTEHKTLQYTGGFWKRPTEDNPAVSMVVNMSDPDHYRRMVKERELSARKAAQMTGMTFDEMKRKPQILKWFIFLHEMGHIHEYINRFQKNPDYGYDISRAALANKKKRDEEMGTLPISGYNPTDARHFFESGEMSKFLIDNREYYASMGINTPEELLARQEEEYRNLPTEKYADEFAADFLKKNREKLRPYVSREMPLAV